MLKPLTPKLALELWRLGAKHEVGVRVPCKQKDLDKITPIMYGARKEVIDAEPELGELMLCVAPGGNEVWIVKKPKDPAP